MAARPPSTLMAIWKFRWVQMSPTDHPGCIPPISNRDPLISSHLGPSYGQKYLIYGLFRPILTPQGPPMAISVGPNVTNRPSWMCPTQIRLLIQPFEPFGATRAVYGQPYPTYGILGSSEPFLALRHNFLKHPHPFRA